VSSADPRYSGALGAVRGLLRNDRAVAWSAILLLTMLAWTYVLTGSGTGMSPLDMSSWRLPLGGGDGSVHGMPGGTWSIGHALMMLAMWWIMMIAMMTPSAAPMVLLYARVAAQPSSDPAPAAVHGRVVAFAGGYLLLWLGFSVLAALAQFGLERSGLLSAMRMGSATAALSGLLLIAAGLYQLTPLKRACLLNCRSPAAFLASHWRKGTLGALRIGLDHGIYCVGCCFALMLLLFVGGVMNLVWIAGLTAVVLLEKLAPWGDKLVRPAAFGLIAAGGLLLAIAAH
jgi:predicted metal-binding membrane protein